LLPAPFRYRLTLSAVTRSTPPRPLIDLLPRLKSALNLIRTADQVNRAV
jgi:hypothetical protein